MRCDVCACVWNVVNVLDKRSARAYVVRSAASPEGAAIECACSLAVQTVRECVCVCVQRIRSGGRDKPSPAFIID